MMLLENKDGGLQTLAVLGCCFIGISIFRQLFSPRFAVAWENSDLLAAMYFSNVAISSVTCATLAFHFRNACFQC